ncbi:response regulator [Leptolyngbya ohadii]|uniref:response regulator n=1 Tax=Leptolyngbya ohadii TaxID=1962290 RepID=UPI000B5A0D96|nr:response regulator [Leptolyngbya ohadii]
MLSRLRIRTKIAIAFGLGLAAVSTIGLIAYRTTRDLVDNSRWESHTYSVLAQLREVEAQIRNAESGQRSYLITGDRRFLEPYEAANQNLQQQFDRLQELMSDNPRQQERLRTLEPLLEERANRLERGIELRQSQGIEGARQFILAGDRGLQVGNEIRQVFSAIEAEEQRLLQQRSGATQQSVREAFASIGIGIPASFVLLALIGYLLSRSISRPLTQLSGVAEKISEGDLSVDLPHNPSRDEIGVLTRTFNQMIANLRETIARNDEQRWLKSNLADLSQLLQGERNLAEMARRVLAKLAPLVEAQQGVFYLLDTHEDSPVLRLLGSYAYRERKHLANQFQLGEGLVGQCALEKQRILLTDVPGDYTQIQSGLGAVQPVNVIVLPIVYEADVRGVMEFASLYRFTPQRLTLLEDAAAQLGVMLNAIAAYARTGELLEESQSLTVQLQEQQEELIQTNQQLAEQAQTLQESELLLKQQQEELQQSNEELQQLNEELEEKAELLETQKREVERKNQEIDLARQAIEEKAEQLALSSKYKSEFLANMSHELRTPLNSLLILAKMLGDNGDGNLSDKQVEYSRTIYSAGTDLLELINDILDLAKIESGTMAIDPQPVTFLEIKGDLERLFRQVALSKGLAFTIELAETLPRSIVTDAKRVQQILKNLLSNAFKFTDQGSVTVQITPAANQQIAFAVTDTGIGIPADKQRIIFEAFQQADGTTSRKYGGTGLGLSISLELAQLLGGSIVLVSQPGQGSIFTLYLPEIYQGTSDQPFFYEEIAGQEFQSRESFGRESSGRESQNRQQTIASNPSNSSPAYQLAPELTPSVIASSPTPPLPPSPTPPLPSQEIDDDRTNLHSGDRILLVIEDDVNFARILLDMARQQGFKVLIALRGKPGIALAEQFLPNAILLDIRLPDMDGWTVLDRLKHNSSTRHIPIHILSVEDRQSRGFHLGAIAHLQKPISTETLTQSLKDIRSYVDRPVKQLMVIEDDPIQARSMIELIGKGEDVQSTAVGTGAEALNLLRSQSFDCVVLDLGLPDMSGLDLIEQIKQDLRLSRLPIIVYTGKELTRQEETQLRRLAESIIIKDVRSPERLLDETALFLHRVQANLSQENREILEQLRQTDPVLAGKKVLIIDDDVRNIFALTSLLERYQMQIIFAENGRDGIEMLQANPGVNVVLMDIMMPEMDGYETTVAIREINEFRNLPIIALTAKAMQGDREKCIEAGASDYITKPVDTEQLVSLLRVWLYR